MDFGRADRLPTGGVPLGGPNYQTKPQLPTGRAAGPGPAPGPASTDQASTDRASPGSRRRDTRRRDTQPPDTRPRDTRRRDTRRREYATPGRGEPGPAAGGQPTRRLALIPVKTVIAGGFGVGKTTFVGAISEIQPLTTEAVMTSLSCPLTVSAPGLSPGDDTSPVRRLPGCGRLSHAPRRGLRRREHPRRSARAHTDPRTAGGARRRRRHRRVRPPGRPGSDRPAPRSNRGHGLHRRRQRLSARSSGGLQELLRTLVGAAQGPDPAVTGQPRLRHAGRRRLLRLLRQQRRACRHRVLQLFRRRLDGAVAELEHRRRPRVGAGAVDAWRTGAGPATAAPSPTSTIRPSHRPTGARACSCATSGTS